MPVSELASTAVCARRSPYLWRDADSFRPQRFTEENGNADFAGGPGTRRCAGLCNCTSRVTDIGRALAASQRRHVRRPPSAGSWAGYRPAAQGSSLYPNEVSSDFAFIPFGGGARKCVGDQFALMEATVILAMLLRQAAGLLRRARAACRAPAPSPPAPWEHCWPTQLVRRRYDFSFAQSAESVGMATGATIHTANGLWMEVRRRQGAPAAAASSAQLAGAAR